MPEEKELQISEEPETTTATGQSPAPDNREPGHCLAGLLGAAGSHVRLGADDTAQVSADTTYPLLSALIRGFFVYLVLISGALLLLPEPFPEAPLDELSTRVSTTAARELYIRLAGLVSLVSFAVSYDPNTFATVLTKAGSIIERRPK